MRPDRMSVPVLLISLAALFSTPCIATSQAPELSKNECTVLKICEGVIQLFRQSSEEVWPGYNLAQQPFIVYLPEKWALLLNCTQPIEGFSAYPEDWPPPGHPALIHRGQYEDLIGQLAFDLPLDTMKVVAIGFPDENLDSLPQPEVHLFGFCVHEAFHQYQSEAFGEIPWEREERYPILDRENTALAYIEMRLLMDALKMMKANDKAKCRGYIEQFVAVRAYRWRRGDPFVRRYEQGQEIHEGTAQYVETKAIELMKTVPYRSAFEGLSGSLQHDFEQVSFPDYIVADLREQMTENSIRPEDMPRNRIYPVGCALGFLLDYFGIDWKNKAQKAGSEFEFARLFADEFDIRENRFGDMADRAKGAYGYERIFASTDKIIAEYQDGFNGELAAFESQGGYRIRIDFASRNFSRSRSSRSKKWLVDKGTRSLCAEYQVYTLKTDNMRLQLQNCGVLEETDWDAKKYAIVFFAPENATVVLDGKQLTIADMSRRSFENIELSADDCTLSCSRGGALTVNQRRVHITLDP